MTDFMSDESAGPHDDSQVVWPVEPGIAVTVLIEPEVLGGAALPAIAAGYPFSHVGLVTPNKRVGPARRMPGRRGYGRVSQTFSRKGTR